MSTSTMWLLLFVVVALALLVAALTKTKFTVQKISIIGVMAALSLVAYEFFRIPNVFGSGSSFHLGNTFTALTAMLLDGVSGGLAGAIGLALADILAGDPGYAITTFILKFIIGLVCGFVAHKVIHLKTVPAGTAISYGRKFVTKRESVIATLPIGYADGYTRTLLNRCRVLIHGEYAPVLGTICMDQIMVDVTDIPGVAVGDEAVLLGRQGQREIPVEELEQASGLCSGELFYGFSCRLPIVVV